MKLKDWALANGITPQTAYAWHKEGRLPVRTTRVGRTILVREEATSARDSTTAIYARVSSSKAQDSLQAQKLRLLEWAVTQNIKVDQVHTEVGSGLNDGRKVWNKLLSDPTITTIIVEHRDRATRFGFDQLSSALKANNRTILVLDPTEVEDDLVKDVTDLLTSLCARLYGKRGARVKAEKALKALEVAHE